MYYRIYKKGTRRNLRLMNVSRQFRKSDKREECDRAREFVVGNSSLEEHMIYLALLFNLSL